MSNHTFFALLLAALLTAGTAFAGTITVEGVQIDKTDKNAVVARDKAIVEAQREAFKALAQRSMSDDAFKHFSLPDDKTIQTLVQDFEIKGERVSANRYAARFTVRFGDLGGYLSVPDDVGPVVTLTPPDPSAKAPEPPPAPEKAAAAPAPTPAPDKAVPPTGRNVLLLPFLQEPGGRKLLWEDPNPWREAWQDNGNATPAADFAVTVPQGDISDISAGDVTGVWQGEDAAVEKLRTAYKATEVALAVFDQSAPSPRVEISVYKNGGLAPLGSVSGVKADEFPAAIARVVAALQSGKVETPQSGKIEAEKKDAPADAAASSASSEQTTVGLVINISGFAQWVDAQKRLAALEPAPTVDIGSLSPRSVEITVTYAGGMEAFRDALGQHGLALGQASGPNTYELTLTN